MSRRTSGPASYTDAWGEDLEEDSAPVATATRRRTPSRTHSAAQLGKASRAVLSGGCQGPPRLEAICLGILALWIEELLDSGPEPMDLLTADARAAMLAVTRRQGLITDGTLSLLLHEDWHRLDLSGAGLPPNELSPAGLLHALQQLPRLEALDMTGCTVTPAILNQLGHLCPLLVELRLGNDAKTDAAMTRALPRLLPAVWQPVQELSWDQVDETAPHLQDGRLAQLRTIVWVGMPAKARTILETQAPKLSVAGQSDSLPCATRWQLPLDEPFVGLVGQYDWTASCSRKEGSGAAVAERPSLAELFKRAYIERDERRAAKAERNYRQALARQWRASPCLRAMRLAEMGVPIK